MVKLYEANIKWIEDIIDLVMENVSCDHQPNSDGTGKIYDSVSYHLNDEEGVLKKCVEAIPEIPIEFNLKESEKFIQEKTMEMIEMVSRGKILEAMSFIRSFINEVLEKINLKGD